VLGLNLRGEDLFINRDYLRNVILRANRGTGVRQLTRGLATPEVVDQEPFVVKAE